jgi:S1-C subfamily serine protease
MAFAIRCPGCESSFNVAENLIGKRIKCNKCGEMVTVAAPAAAKAAAPAKPTRAAVLDDDDDDLNIHRPAKPARRRDDDDEPVRARTAKRRDEDSDEFDRPRKGAKADAGKSKTPLLIGSLAALLVLGGGAGAYFAFFNKKDTAQTTTTAPTTAPTVAPVAGKTDEGDKADEGKKTDEETKANESTKTDEGVKSASTTDKKPGPSGAQQQVAPVISSVPPTGSTEQLNKLMRGEIDEITLRKVKAATVYIDVDEKNGGGGTGSGWFGLEPNIVFTNAHVLGMKSPGSPPPVKITMYVNSGERGQTPGVSQREIPNNRIKILGVDRDNDLAILQIIGEKDLPEPLKVRPTLELRETQKLATFGFPYGNLPGAAAGGGANQPVVSIRPTAVVAKRHDQYGEIRLLQIEGAVNEGNSGGPICDAEGYVVGVSVKGLIDHSSGGLTSMVFGVATEQVLGLISGRIDQVEYEQPYNDGDKVKVPVKMTVVDPLGRFRKAGVGQWIGDTSVTFRPPGGTRTATLPSDKDFTQVELKYDPVKKTAHGELVFNKTAPGLAYWAQPYYSNIKTPVYWNPGTTIPMPGPAVDRVNATLRVTLRAGTTRPLTMTTEQTRANYFEGEGAASNDRTRVRFTMKGTEKLLDPDRNDRQSAARLRLTYDDIDIKIVKGDGREVQRIAPRDIFIFKQGINQLEAYGFLDRFGHLYKYNTNALGVTNPLVRAIGPSISDECLFALQVCSINIPNRELKPLETWGGSITQTFKTVSGTGALPDDEGEPPQPAPPSRPGAKPAQPRVREYKYTSSETFTYLGTRTRGGRLEAVVKVEGKALPAAGQAADSVSGFAKGYAFVDVATGAVLDSGIETEFEFDTSERGFKRRFSALGKYKITRGGQTN